MKIFSFNPSDGLLNTNSFPSSPATENEARGQIQTPLNQLRDFINYDVRKSLVEMSETVIKAERKIDDFFKVGGEVKGRITVNALTIKEEILLEDSPNWKAYHCMRNGAKASFGVGFDALTKNPGYAAIETWRPGATGYASRWELKEDLMQFTNGQAWGKFYTADSTGHGGISIGTSSAGYLKFMRGHTDIQFRNYSDNAFTRACASQFLVSSKRKFKTDIKDLDSIDVTAAIMNNNIKEYHLISEINEKSFAELEAESKGYVLGEENTKVDKKVGLIIDDLTEDVRPILNPNNTDCLDIYGMCSLLWKHNQSLQNEINQIKELLKTKEV